MAEKRPSGANDESAPKRPRSFSDKDVWLLEFRDDEKLAKRYVEMLLEGQEHDDAVQFVKQFRGDHPGKLAEYEDLSVPSTDYGPVFARIRASEHFELIKGTHRRDRLYDLLVCSSELTDVEVRRVVAALGAVMQRWQLAAAAAMEPGAKGKRSTVFRAGLAKSEADDLEHRNDFSRHYHFNGEQGGAAVYEPMLGRKSGPALAAVLLALEQACGF